MLPAPELLVSRRDTAWFASDLHLQDDCEGLICRFFDALGQLASVEASGQASPALFLLGDLFEYWVGDDHSSKVSQALSQRLHKLHVEGWRVFLMHGNRDFLLGPATAAACGATLLPDPCVVGIEGERIVLAHGDAQCIDDRRYQQWRALCRSETWQADFLTRPLDERLRMALAMREQSRLHQLEQRSKSGTMIDTVVGTTSGTMTETSVDLDQASIDALMSRFGASGMIHGHTHRPGLHRWSFDGQARWRRVLSDWAVDPPRGEILNMAQILAET